MALAVLLGLAGLFGQGPLARREAAAQGLTLRYQRVVRLEATQSLDFVLEARQAGEIGLELDSRFVSRAEIERIRSEEHTSDLQSLMRISYAVFCFKQKK